MDTLEAVFDGKMRRAEYLQPVMDFKQQQQQQQMIWKQEAEVSLGVDQLLAHAGYNVRASDLTQVAQRIEELDTLLGTTGAPDQLLPSDTIHYNPSDLMGWIEGMLDELGPPLPMQQQQSRGDSSSEMDSIVTTAMQMDSSCYALPPMAAAAGFQEQQGGFAARSNGGELYPNVLYAEQVDLSSGKGTASDLQQQQQQGSPQVIVSPTGSSQIVQQQRPCSSSSSSGVASQQQNHMNQMRAPAVGMSSIQEQQQQNDELSGVRLIHLLLACANAVQRGEITAAEEMLQQLRLLVVSSSGAMARVATHFVEGLSRRIQNTNSENHLPHLPHFPQQQQNQQNHQIAAQQQQNQLQIGRDDQEGSAMDEILHFHFYETCPYLKFAHFTANQAILEALEGHKCVHVVDLNLQYGLQWPALIQALALRPGGPPTLRLTGIGPPQSRGNDLLQEIGLKLAQLAESVNVEFAFHGVVAARLDDVQPWMLTLRRGEAVAVNSVFQLHKVLVEERSDNATVGSGQNHHHHHHHRRGSPIDEVLRLVRNLKPKIVTLVEQDADHNGPVFLERFMSALHYYSTMFDSLEACNLAAPGSVERMVAETYLGREIVNIVACEGAARSERHETLAQWRKRMARSGFQPLYLGSNAFKQANMLLHLFSGDGYRVEEKNGCLTLGWHSRPLVAASAWQCC